MKIPRLLLAGLKLVLGVTSATAADEPRPNVVAIQSFAKEDADKPQRESLGFVVEEDGFLLTNYQNLIDPASHLLLPVIRVVVPEEEKSETFEATVIGVEPTIGLGLLKIDAGRKLAKSNLSRSKIVQLDQPVRAIAAIKGGTAEEIQGTVAGLNNRECYQENLASTMFRTKLDIPVTGAGGPVYNSDGEVIAIYTGFKPEAVEGHVENEAETHVLPIALALNIYESIKHKKSHKSPWTGFSVRPLTTEEMKRFPTAKGHKGGLGIEYVWPGSPAEKMGILPGDILVQFSYNRILSVGDFQKWLYMYGVGHPVKLVVIRDGEYLVSDYMIEERPEWAKPK
ncbi:S1C family serine protease [Luteolibacter arcticus]|uniref:S1C family serine protease n=1 Tax=Luteolibacter arcticus TaxID=1581411 RepID=A0ABT3GQ70_9BACT|nr:S1C family serine protease [Luteolibacter arcticus]MCW1925669.1 S1C family serine protease [Luteolibacter arcticus]